MHADYLLSDPSAGNLDRQEVRAVERRVLLETLASKLPPGTISFSSKLKSIAEQGPDGTLLELEDGRQILSKVSAKDSSSKFGFHTQSIQRASNAELEMFRYCLNNPEGTLLIEISRSFFLTLLT